MAIQERNSELVDILRPDFIPNNGNVTITMMGMFVAVRTVVAVATATTADHVILADAIGGAFAVNLPAAATVERLVLHVKKIDASVNAVTVTANGVETIDGAITQVIPVQYSSIMVVSDGTSWHII